MLKDRNSVKNINLKTSKLRLSIRLHHFSHETIGTFNSLLGVRVERGESGGFLEDLPKIGFKIETLVMMISEWLFKTETLKKSKS